MLINTINANAATNLIYELYKLYEPSYIRHARSHNHQSTNITLLSQPSPSSLSYIFLSNGKFFIFTRMHCIWSTCMVNNMNLHLRWCDVTMNNINKERKIKLKNLHIWRTHTERETVQNFLFTKKRTNVHCTYMPYTISIIHLYGKGEEALWLWQI